MWWTSCVHKIMMIDPVGNVLQDFTSFLEANTVSRTKLRIRLSEAGEKAWETIQKTKIPDCNDPGLIDQGAPQPQEMMAGSHAAVLPGWSAREFSRGKRGEENVMKWMLALPNLYKKQFNEDLISPEGKIKICQTNGSVQVLDWSEIASRTPMHFDALLKQTAQYGIQITWQLSALVPGGNKQACRSNVMDFCSKVVSTTPPLLPVPSAVSMDD